MRFVLPVFAKLNLTLRVTGRREDGYHDLMSVFLRVPSGETLFVTPNAETDRVEMRGLDLTFEGENIVSKALRLVVRPCCYVGAFIVPTEYNTYPSVISEKPIGLYFF